MSDEMTDETNLFPQDLLSAEYQTANSQNCWWAMYTLSRREKDLMRRLQKKSIAYYCPIAPHHYRSPKGRKRMSMLPLFRNYVFVCGSESDRYKALTTNCVSKPIEVVDKPALLERLRECEVMIQTDQDVTYEATIQAGDYVRVKTGPMKGIKGTVFQRRGKKRLLAFLELIGGGLSVELDDWLLEKI